MTNSDFGLSPDEQLRYSRQILFPKVGESGQKKLKGSHVVVAGIGGLGSPAATYLACAGVGRISIVDSDCVEPSNLNRQILHYEEDIGEKKVLSAARKLKKLNSHIEVLPVFDRISPSNVQDIIRGAQAVVDGTDNRETRMCLNSACFAEGIPFIHGGVRSFMGHVTTIMPGKTPCLACIAPYAPSKKGFPVFGAMPGLVAMLQVIEVLKLVCGFGDLLTGRMLYINGETMQFAVRDLAGNPDVNYAAGDREQGGAR